MKKIFNQLVGTLAFSILLFSCESDLEKVVLQPGNGPVHVTVNTDVPLVCSAENAKDRHLSLHGRLRIMEKIYLLPIHYRLMWQGMILQHRKKSL